MIPAELIQVLIFVCITCAVLALAWFVAPSPGRVAERVRELSGAEPPVAESGPVGQLVRGAVTRIATALLPSDAQRQDRLRLRLAHAGFYGRQAIQTFLVARLVLALVPPAAVAVVVFVGELSLETGAIVAFVFLTLGLVAPGIWLDSRKKARQNDLRRGLPDFFDVLVLCIEGGMSLLAAWRRVADELRHAYPALWIELKQVQREAELGHPMGEILHRFAERTDLDELTSLASVVGQAERLGTELARPLRTLSDTLRLLRVQKAEETAHKTATKIMFPTLLFIFPGVFAIILGPMIVQVLNIFSGEQK